MGTNCTGPFAFALDFGHLDSFLPAQSPVWCGSALLVPDFLHLGSFASVRSFVCADFSMSVMMRVRLGFFLFAPDYCDMGLLLSARSLASSGLPMSLKSFAWVDLAFLVCGLACLDFVSPVLDFVELASAVSIRSYFRPDFAMLVLGPFAS